RFSHADLRLVSKKPRSRRSLGEWRLGDWCSSQRRGLNDNAKRRQADKENRRAGRRQSNGMTDQIRTNHRRHDDQRPIKEREEQNRADNSADDERNSRITRAFGK